jgi:hypothetical protein
MEEKETYDTLIRVDDAYCIGKKRPTIEEKETYYRGKRDLLRPDTGG